MLIIEGSDCVGKTTLCRELLKRLNAVDCAMIPQHFGQLPKNWDYYRDYLPYISSHTVMDRFIMSEIVYGHVLRGRSPLLPEMYRLLDARLRLCGAVTVLIVANDAWYDEQLRDKYSEREQAFTVDQVKAVNAGFKRLALRCRNESWTTDYTVDIDFPYVCDKDTGYPANDDLFINTVVSTFVKRQQSLRRCGERSARWNGTYTSCKHS